MRSSLPGLQTSPRSEGLSRRDDNAVPAECVLRPREVKISESTPEEQRKSGSDAEYDSGRSPRRTFKTSCKRSRASAGRLTIRGWPSMSNRPRSRDRARRPSAGCPARIRLLRRRVDAGNEVGRQQSRGLGDAGRGSGPDRAKSLRTCPIHITKSKWPTVTDGVLVPARCPGLVGSQKPDRPNGHRSRGPHRHIAVRQRRPHRWRLQQRLGHRLGRGVPAIGVGHWSVGSAHSPLCVPGSHSGARVQILGPDAREPIGRGLDCVGRRCARRWA